MENLIKIIKQVERKHKGLGVPLTLNLLTIYARKGIFNIGSRGGGKGAIMESIHHFDHKQGYVVTRWDNVTLTEMLERIPQANQEVLIWIIEEISTLNRYHRDLLIPMASKIITQGSFHKKMSNKDVIDIVDCDLAMLIGIQPLNMQRTQTESTGFESLATDRFLKLILLNPLRSVRDQEDNPPSYDIPDVNIDYDDIKFTTDFDQVNKLFAGQVSMGRTRMFSKDYLRAYARMNNIEMVDNKVEQDFVDLYGVYIRLYPALIYAHDLDKPDSFSVGSVRLLEHIVKDYHHGKTSSELAKKFHVYNYREGKYEVDTDTVTHHMRPLVHAKIVTNHTRGQVVRYQLTKPIMKYFDDYKANWCT